MAQESRTTDFVALARRFAEVFNNGDFDAVMSRYSPNAVWDATGMGLVTYEGHAAIREFLKEWFGFFEQSHLTLEEITDIIFTTCLLTGRMKGSSGELGVRYATVTEWTDAATRVTNPPGRGEPLREDTGDVAAGAGNFTQPQQLSPRAP
jgi:ketosteroid isomerase-like protein